VALLSYSPTKHPFPVIPFSQPLSHAPFHNLCTDSAFLIFCPLSIHFSQVQVFTNEGEGQIISTLTEPEPFLLSGLWTFDFDF
jgi:hypothetical protein